MNSLSIDRFEGRFAVLVTNDGREIDFPRSLLPIGAKAGNVLNIIVDVSTTESLRRKTREIQDELRKSDPGGDVRL